MYGRALCLKLCATSRSSRGSNDGRVVDIWNHTKDEFDQRHHRGILAYMREHDIADRRAVDVHRGSGRGRTGGTQSRPQECDPMEEVQEFLDEEARRAEAGGVEEGEGTGTTPNLSGEEVVMTARGSSVTDHHEGDARGRAGKRPVESGVEGVPQARKRQGQSRLDEVYDPDGRAGFRDTFLQWVYDSGIRFAAFRRQSWLRHKNQLAAMPRGVRPIYPSFKDIGGDGIVDQRGKVIRCADFWRNVHHAVAVMTPVHQRLRRLDRGGMIMSTIYSWSQELVRQVAVSDVPDDMHGPCVEAVQIRTMHMLEPAHVAAHLLNPRKCSLRYYESVHRTAADLEVVTECDSFLLAQTGGDPVGDTYLQVREQMRSFHTRIGHTTDRVTRDAEAEACIGDEETSSERSGGYVLPWCHMATLAEAQPEEYTHLVVDDEDEEDEPEPEEWGARAQSAVSAHEIIAQVRRFQQQGAHRPGGVVEVFGARTEILLPYDHVPPPPLELVQASENQTDTKGGEHLPPGVDKSVERLYYMYGGGANGFQPCCTFIRESDDDFIPATDIGLERGQRDASGGASGVGGRGVSGDALGRSSGVPSGGCKEREVTGLGSADDDDDDDGPLVLRRAQLARQGAAPAAEGLRRSARLQTLAGSTSGGRREVSDHPYDIRAEERLPSQHTPTSAPRGDREQTELCTSDFQGLGPGFAGIGVRGWVDGRERVGDEVEYHPMEGGGAESTEELHAQMDREEEQRLERLQREWAGRDAYMAEQQCLRDLERGTTVPDAGGVEHSVPIVLHPFAANAATPDTPVPETSPQGDVDSGFAMGGDFGASEYGDPTVSNVILGLCVAATLQPDPPATHEAVPMDGDSSELDGGRRPDAEGDDGASDPDRLAPAHSAGSGRSSHGPIGGDTCGPVQGDAHVDEAGGSISLALVLRDPSPVAHEDPSHPAEGGGGVDEEGEGGTTHDRPNPVRADMEEGQITPGLLDPYALHRALVEDPISRGPAGSLGVGVRSPPRYTPLSPLYSGSPARLEREQQRSESIRAAASGARTTRIPPVTPPPPTTLHGTPTTVTGSIAERGHMSSSLWPRLDT
ncbi:hypothetical protein CBR_g36708 [Chara braunii]|uniref:Uncharacterized protein n=1 Tax=Chara braunii TaxID=69332 RepID=A0A388LL86_CHABU|nr:hypothetical protein CBR_g36708 [Chara braunii]|eukprot:GBG83090.1 hypothetical protein CBR_g36708 [Chara braunii]